MLISARLCTLVGWLEFNVPFQHKYGYIRDDMHVGNRDDSSTYYMEGSELAEISYKKDLGVWISANMKCRKQRMYAFKKATTVLGMIKRTIRFKDTRVMMSQSI